MTIPFSNAVFYHEALDGSTLSRSQNGKAIKMRWKSLGLIVLIGVVVLAILFVPLRPMGHRLVVKAYFTNAMGLRAGAPVRFAGVDIGSVKSVRAKPEVKNSPVEVVMVLNPPYELKIPNDSAVSLETAGILGETFVDIDAASATGPPIGPNAVLKAKPTVQFTTERFIEKLSEAWGRKNCDCDTKKDAAASANAVKKSPSTNP
jgi:phospholipid/cholesterol/gamma-HCH transport system substrate-binding protein